MRRSIPRLSFWLAVLFAAPGCGPKLKGKVEPGTKLIVMHEMMIQIGGFEEASVEERGAISQALCNDIRNQSELEGQLIAIYLLASLGPPEASRAVAQLEALLRHEDGHLRLASAYALGNVGSEALGALPAIADHLVDSKTSLKVRMVSLRAITSILRAAKQEVRPRFSVSDSERVANAVRQLRMDCKDASDQALVDECDDLIASMISKDQPAQHETTK